jgi:hypothetical protein
MPDELPPLFDPAEDCGERTPREILARHGCTPVSPEKLDRQLPGRLWELWYAAAARRLVSRLPRQLERSRDATLAPLLRLRR